MTAMTSEWHTQARPRVVLRPILPASGLTIDVGVAGDGLLVGDGAVVLDRIQGWQIAATYQKVLPLTPKCPDVELRVPANTGQNEMATEKNVPVWKNQMASVSDLWKWRRGRRSAMRGHSNLIVKLSEIHTALQCIFAVGPCVSMRQVVRHSLVLVVFRGCRRWIVSGLRSTYKVYSGWSKYPNLTCTIP